MGLPPSQPDLESDQDSREPDRLMAPEERIDRRALTAWRVSGALWTLVVFVLTGLLFVLFVSAGLSWYWRIGLLSLAVVFAVLTVGVVPAVRWRRWRYQVTEGEIDLQRGVLIVTRTLIPISRVQHVDTRQGPIMRHYGLAGVAIATAGGVHEIPALALDVAEGLRDRIAHLAGVSEDV